MMVQVQVWLFGILVIFSSTCPAFHCRKNQDQSAREDASLSVPEIIAKYGYPAEIHQVITRDGYILELHRIPSGRKNNTQNGKPVLLNHGLEASSAGWIITGPGNAFGYMVADAGYDVWLMNNRGNTYSRNHTYLSVKSQAFWNFDWHEMGIYDLPAVVDYILGVTQNSKLIHIGHSQGTTSFYVFLSMLPEYNSKIDFHISLAPIAFMGHVTSPPSLALVPGNQPGFAMFRLLGIKAMFPASKLRTKLTNTICDRGDPLQPACMYFITAFFQSPANLNKTTYVATVGHYPAGSSWKQFEHYGQQINSGHFRQYDYGRARNRKVYNRTTPPDYDLTQIKVPVYLFEGPNDLLADKEDVDLLEKELPNVVQRHMVSDQRFEHNDFLWGIDAKDVVYAHLLEILKNRQD